MKSQLLLALPFGGLAVAQNLSEALSANSGSLSALSGLLSTQPELLSILDGATNITILAPDNQAVEDYVQGRVLADILETDQGAIPALLSYHVLNGTYDTSDVADSSAFIKTLLSNSTYENVTGGQVVEAIQEDGTVGFYSGLRALSKVTTANINFTGGVIHVINSLLKVPRNLTDTALAANLTAAAGAFTQANINERLDSLQDITVFAPSNRAFAEVSSALTNLSAREVEDILRYHVVQGSVEYSNKLQNSTLTALDGTDLNIAVVDGTVFVNGARVIASDLLISNGVLHVIDGVLNPNNTGTVTNTAVAFPGASSASGEGVPFTSGVSSATEVITDMATESATPTATEAAAPRVTGMVAVGALFGGAVVLMNGM